MHPLWAATPYHKMDIMRATVKARLLVGRYYLQSDLNKFRSTTSPCPLCHLDSEDLIRFLYFCPAFEYIRTRFKDELQNVFTACCSVLQLEDSSIDTILRTQMLLDISYLVSGSTPINEVEDVTRRFLYALHCGRASLMNKPRQ